MRALDPAYLDRMDAYWRAANYLSVGQIYLKDNPLLDRPLTIDDIKPRLLGHWGTTPGLNFIYTHLNRLINEHDLDMIYIIGPGHGGPGIVAHTYLEGSYTEIYPHVEQNREGLERLFRQFSWPYGIPSHVAPETPGSIHEGGELGYSLLHAYGAAYDNPDLIVACVVGDGEAETGPCAASWHSTKFLNPAQDGAVLPILHLNGYKIANPTVLARITREELESLFVGYGYAPHYLEGDDPRVMHQQMAAIARRDPRRDPGDPAAGPGGRPCCAPSLAHADPPHTQGLDRAQGRRRQAGRRHLALPPGAAQRAPGEAGAPADPRRLDAELSAGRAVRCGRPARAGRWPRSRPRADRRMGHESARERRPAARAAAAARISGATP